MAKINRKRKNLIKLLKIFLGIFLIFLVFSKIDFRDVWAKIKDVEISYLLISMLMVFLAQCFSGLRMRYYLKKSGMFFAKIYAVSFYLIGTMLNNVVPGGIGGDGFKAFYFKKKYGFPWKKTILVVVRGRVSALFFLFLTSIVVSLLYIEKIDISNLEYILFASLVALFPIYIIIADKFLGEDVKTMVGAFVYSIPVQLSYILALLSVLYSMGDMSDFLGYLLVYQVANIVAIIPVSIGGIGIREYIFIILAEHIGLDVGVGIAASLIIYSLYIFISISGSVPYLFLKKLDQIQIKYMDRYHPNKLF